MQTPSSNTLRSNHQFAHDIRFSIAHHCDFQTLFSLHRTSSPWRNTVTPLLPTKILKHYSISLTSIPTSQDMYLLPYCLLILLRTNPQSCKSLYDQVEVHVLPFLKVDTSFSPHPALAFISIVKRILLSSDFPKDFKISIFHIYECIRISYNKYNSISPVCTQSIIDLKTLVKSKSLPKKLKSKANDTLLRYNVHGMGRYAISTNPHPCLIAAEKAILSEKHHRNCNIQ